MRSLILPALLSTGLAFGAPVHSQTDLSKVVGGIAQALLQSELDKQAYLEAQSLNTVEGYRQYLKAFPKGVYKSRAEEALARLGAPVKGTLAWDQKVESDLLITASQRVTVQRELIAQGHLRGFADGVWGAMTRSAIASWQKAQDMRATGYLTQGQLTKLLKAAAARMPVVVAPEPVEDIGTAAQIEANMILTRSQRAEIQRELTLLGHNAGVADGLWGTKTRSAIASWQRANKKPVTGYVTPSQITQIAAQAAKKAPTPEPVADAELQERLLGLTQAERRDLQLRLTTLGYSTRGADGIFGANTRFAIRSWQSDYNRAASGYLSAEDIRLIYKQTAG